MSRAIAVAPVESHVETPVEVPTARGADRRL